MTETTPPAVPPPPAAAPGRDADVRADNHRFNLRVLQRIPHALDYITPEEILLLIRLSGTYTVDWTVGLEPRGERGELVRTFALRVPDDDSEAYRTTWKKVRVRRERMLQDPGGVLVPDADIVWAQQLIGILHDAIDERLDARRP